MTEPTCRFCNASDKHRCKIEKQAATCMAGEKKDWDERRIYEWACDMFGQNDPLAIAIRMNKEMSELLSALNNGRFEEARKECYDLEIFLRQVHYALHGTRGNIQQGVNQKMEINVGRSWEIAPDGSHQHVEE